MISDYLTDKLDVLTTKLQRRGYRLTNMQVWAVFIIFVASIMGNWLDGSLVLMVINGTAWGINLWTRAKWAERNKDYPESVQIMKRLNAESLWWRERLRWLVTSCIYIGAMFVGTCIALLLSEPRLSAACIAVSWVMIPTCFMLHGCTFIGPGEFAKQERESELHNAVLDKLP
jgi:hypothetical protein